jgi:hypothetical protein
MTGFEPGQRVHVKCSIQPGAFADERLVTLDTVSGPISGFVASDHIVHEGHEEGYLAATIDSVSKESVTLWIEGSFFTTNGLADLSPSWAQANVEPALA